VLQDYRAEKRILTQEPVDDGVLLFTNPLAFENGNDAMLEAAE
jgi:hypothetical protein